MNKLTLVILSMFVGFPCYGMGRRDVRSEFAYKQTQKKQQGQFDNEQLIRKMKVTQNWRCESSTHVMMYLMLFGALCSPALCQQVDVRELRKQVQTSDIKGIKVLSAAEVYQMPEATNAASSYAEVKYPSSEESVSEKAQSDARTLREIIEEKADSELCTAEDCIVEFNGKRINLLYQAYKAHLDPEASVWGHILGRMLGRHILMSLEHKELTKLLKIKDETTQQRVTDVIKRSDLQKLLNDMYKVSPSLREEKGCNRAKKALEIEKSIYDAQESKKMDALMKAALEKRAKESPRVVHNEGEII